MLKRYFRIQTSLVVVEFWSTTLPSLRICVLWLLTFTSLMFISASTLKSRLHSEAEMFTKCSGALTFWLV